MAEMNMCTIHTVATLALESGKVFYGRSFGATGEVTGEVVFNTALTGYQEVLTDPSYKGQIVAMTYPHIGNYGICNLDNESRQTFLEGFVVREISQHASNWRSQGSVVDFLKNHGVLGISDIDTRALTRHLRESGAMRGILSTQTLNAHELTAKAKAAPGLSGRDLVSQVTALEAYPWTEALWPQHAALKSFERRVVVVDCGVKYNILRSLVERNCAVTVVPANTSLRTIVEQKPDGVLVSNGPGDPEAVPYVVQTIRELLEFRRPASGRALPVFGICLGHQMLGLALGGKTYKLKFGHHGINHPVRDLATGRIEITSQNHGFCLDMDSLPKEDVEVTHINLNDNTVEGIRHKRLPAFSVQYHPEAGPGPSDAQYLFDRFVQLMDKNN